ncbi:MAG TPA: phospholipid carrier-dependent glycosyltransferase [Actinomycetota bacterium]|jgi:dolichyl-phosphate-mannose--protein O-mannosyl transferase
MAQAPPTDLPPEGSGIAVETDQGSVRGTRAQRFARRPWFTRFWVLIIAVTALAAGLRLWHLSSPHTYVFDEVYYAKDACYDAGIPWQQCQLQGPGEQTFTVHPPLGRWIIAGGVAAFGNRPFGWRIASAIAGTVSVLLAGILGFRLFGSALWGAVSGLLLATEGLNLVQSRVSMLDIFLTVFVVAGFLFLVLDRQWAQRRTPELAPTGQFEPLALPPDRVPSPIVRPWRIAAGLAFGAAVATKWSGAQALLAAIVLSVIWERGRRARAGIDGPFWEGLREESFGIFVFLVLVPIAVYMASYLRWWVDHGFALSDWWSVQKGMADYSIHLRATHPYASAAWKWILLMRPVAYYYQCAKTCSTPAEIIALGNPMIFWGSLIALPYAAVAGWRRRDWVAGFIIATVAFQYLPWFLVARTSFFFYMAPITPFLVLAVVYGLRDLAAARVGEMSLAWVAGVLVVLSVGMFFFFWPVYVGDPISHAAWQQRIWFGCSAGQRWCFWNWV